MPTVDLYLQTPVVRTPRVLQLEGIFDLPPSRVSHGRWVARLPFEEKAWHIGLIVGPSGSGKSSIARQLWPAQMAYEPAWPEDRAIIDAFPEQRSIKQIVALLCSVGFSSPPAWLRPYRVLSTGQQFRAKLARLLAEASPSQLPPCNLSVNPADRLRRVLVHGRSDRRPPGGARARQDRSVPWSAVSGHHLS